MAQKRSVKTSIVSVVSIVLGVYFVITSLTNIGVYIKMLFTNFSGYKQHIFQMWPVMITSDIEFFIHESLYILYYLLRCILGLACILPAKANSKWKWMVIWGSVSLLFTIFHNLYLLRITGQITYNALPYIMMSLSILLGVINKYISTKHNT